jgi:hypothetical protein
MYGKQICAEVFWEMSYKQWLGRLRREGHKLDVVDGEQCLHW